ncbi:hypothetical protein GCM10027298_23950 [Epidermidibacterium keratini]
MLIDEFGVDTADGWHTNLEDGREKWRRKQLRSAVRDSPREAADVLRRMGYEVYVPDNGEPADRVDKLRKP